MPDTAQLTTPLGDWKTAQANARRCITDEYEVRARLSDGACLSTPFDAADEHEDIVCVEAGETDGITGRRSLICLDYDEFTIAGAALLEQRDSIIATQRGIGR